MIGRREKDPGVDAPSLDAPSLESPSLEALSLEDYEEAVVFSEWRALRHGSSRSLERTAALMDALGYDPTAANHRTLGVVGSKGKGTAAAYASAALAGLGCRVGTVMSPGVISNADRIRIDGEAVDEAARRRALGRIQQAKQQLPVAAAETGYLAPTGLFIVMAMLIFAEAEVDAVVAEAGIGGASDDLSHWRLDGVAVTGIFAEHLDLLGPTVADVAADKAAVITADTGFCLSFAQSAEPAAVLQARCAATSTALLAPNGQAEELVSHLPASLQRENAALGVSAGLALAASAHAATSAGSQSWDTTKARCLLHTSDFWCPQCNIDRDAAQTSDGEERLLRTVSSVSYPGRMSVHTTPSGRRCVVDSAVSGSGLAAALDFARSALGTVDQVLVCLPPAKDLAGFIAELEGLQCRRVFVELPGAYTGMPDRTDWPWEWVRQDALDQLLDSGDSLAVGTVLYTSLVLKTLGAEAQRLFTPE